MLNIEAIRKQQGMTQKDVARAMGISPVALSRLLHRGRPDYDTLERLADALGVDIPDLFEQSHTRLVCPHCGGVIHLDVK